MAEKYKEKEGIKYSQMDAKAMNFHEGEFDAILDKATLDAVLVIFDLINSAAKTPQPTQAS